eukprot:1154560-Pelagomonas_calceolata.AAC.18
MEQPPWTTPSLASPALDRKRLWEDRPPENCQLLVYTAPPEPHPGVPSMPNQTLAPNKQLFTLGSRFGSAWQYISHFWHRIRGLTQGQSSSKNWGMCPHVRVAVRGEESTWCGATGHVPSQAAPAIQWRCAIQGGVLRALHGAHVQQAHFSAATLIASPAGPLLSSDMLGAFPGWLAAAQWRPGQGGGGVGPTHQQQGGHHPSLHICSGLAHRQQGGHQPGAKSGERWGPEPLYKVSTMSADGRCLLLRMRKVTTMFADSQGLSPHAF